MAKITIVGGAGAIGLVHAWMLHAAGHTVTILDARPDGQPGDSYRKLLKADNLSFRFFEMDEVVRNLSDSGETVEELTNRFNLFPAMFKLRINQFIPQTSERLSREECVNIINDITSLSMNGIHLAQTSQDILEPQDIIAVTVKCAALTDALGNKIKAISQHSNTPVVVFANGIQPWIRPEPEFGSLRLRSIDSIYDFVDCIGVDKVKAGVLIKYGAAIVGEGAVCVRSKFFNTRNIIANITNTDITEDLGRISDLYTHSGIITDSTQNIKHIILDKLSYNLAGSIMGAIFNYTMGELIENKSTEIAVRDCAKELFQLAVRLGVQLAITDLEFISKTVDALKQNHTVISSPLQDIRAGRATEKDFLIRATIELANTYGMDMPVLQSMYDLISMIEKKSSQNIAEGQELQAEVLQRIEQGNIICVAGQYNQTNTSMKKSTSSSFFSDIPLIAPVSTVSTVYEPPRVN